MSVSTVGEAIQLARAELGKDPVWSSDVERQLDLLEAKQIIQDILTDIDVEVVRHYLLLRAGDQRYPLPEDIGYIQSLWIDGVDHTGLRVRPSEIAEQ